MPSNRCVNCASHIVFIKGVGYVNMAGEKCNLSPKVTAPHIPTRNA